MGPFCAEQVCFLRPFSDEMKEQRNSRVCIAGTAVCYAAAKGVLSGGLIIQGNGIQKIGKT